jgi:enoyl-CoA hydratase/carnithine racemase
MGSFRGSTVPVPAWKHFDFAVDRGVASVRFTRPERLNALTFEIYADLRDLLTELSQRDDVRVLTITGTGRGFCSGGDVEAIIGALRSMDARDLLALQLGIDPQDLHRFLVVDGELVDAHHQPPFLLELLLVFER